MMALHCRRANVSSPIIAMEGAEIRIWETGNTICHFSMERNAALALMEFCHHIGVDYTFYTPHTAYFRLKGKGTLTVPFQTILPSEP